MFCANKIQHRYSLIRCIEKIDMQQVKLKSFGLNENVVKDELLKENIEW